MTRPPLYAFVIAMVLGLVAAATPANLPLESPSLGTALLASTAVFALAGLICGVLWPTYGWRWGWWIVGPGLVLVTVGVISSRNFGQFLGDDLPFLAVGLVGACLGGALGDKMRGKSETGA